MLKSLSALTFLAIMFISCSDNSSTVSSTGLSFTPSSSEIEILDVTGDITETVPEPVPTIPPMFSDPNFHPDTVNAEDYIIPNTTESFPGYYQATKTFEDGSPSITLTYDFSSLLTGDHVVLFKTGGMAIFSDDDD